MSISSNSSIALLTSYPLNVGLGSGVVRMIMGYAEALNRMDVPAQVIHPDFEPTSYLNLAVQRIAFNKRLSSFSLKDFSILLGSDFDGFALERSMPKIALNAGILADIVRFERGRTAQILSHLAKRECQNVRSAQKVVVPSEYTAKKVKELYGLPQERIHMIPLGIDLQEWKQCLDAAPARKGETPTVLCVARQYPRKGVSDLIRAMAIVRQKLPEVKLQLVGGGQELEKNKALAKELGLEHSVDFAGDVIDLKQLAAYYRSASVFCLPSYHETFGIVFLEAMAAGLPIVTYRSSAIPEVVSEKEGILCPPSKVDALAENLLTLLFDARLRFRMGRNGLQKVKKFTWDASARQLMEIVSDVQS